MPVDLSVSSNVTPLEKYLVNTGLCGMGTNREISYFCFIQNNMHHLLNKQPSCTDSSDMAIALMCSHFYSPCQVSMVRDMCTGFSKPTTPRNGSARRETHMKMETATMLYFQDSAAKQVSVSHYR